MSTTDIVWAVLGVATLGFEGRGIIRNVIRRAAHRPVPVDDTISQHIWGVRHWHVGRFPAGYVAIGGFLVWLSYHFLLGGP